MTRSHRGSHHTHPSSLLLPFALTLTTAAIASAGLYFFSSSSDTTKTAAYASDSEHERGPSSSSRRRPTRGRRSRSYEHDRITEEDTDEIEESRREEEERLRRKKGMFGGVVGEYVSAAKGRLEKVMEGDEEWEENKEWGREERAEQRTGHGQEQRTYHPTGMVQPDEGHHKIQMVVAEDAKSDYAPPVGQPVGWEQRKEGGAAQSDTAVYTTQSRGEQTRSEQTRNESTADIASHSSDIASRSADLTSRSAEPIRPGPTPVTAAALPAQQPTQYVPPPSKRAIAIVLSERAALQGHDSDNEFEEALLPTRSLLSRLPHPLNLRSSTLYILIHSPHLSSHPLTSAPKPAAAASQSLGVASSLAAPGAPSPMPSPSLAPTKMAQEDASKSTWDLAKDVLNRANLPHENIMPFTDISSVVPMLRQLEAATVYIEEAVLGERGGEVVGEVLRGGKVGGVVVVVGGDEELAGLMSDDEDRGTGKWWEEGGDVRKRWGRKCEVVESWVVEDDWRRRVSEV